MLFASNDKMGDHTINFIALIQQEFFVADASYLIDECGICILDKQAWGYYQHNVLLEIGVILMKCDSKIESIY